MLDVRHVTVLDVRWRLGGPPGRELYDAGHIPGAVFVDLDADLAAAPGAGGRHPLPEAADFERAMRLAGVRDGLPVIVYDDADATAAARAWWLLRYHGHRDVRVLDGGFRAWAAAGLPTAPPLPDSQGRVGDFTARPGQLDVVDAAGAAAVARTGLLLDARAGERYRGETEPVDPVAGHIPGAVSAPTSENVNSDGTFRSPAELAARFAALGAADGRQVAAYCGSGVTAAHEVLALTRAGIPAALYPGSWSGWITDPSRPVATGPARHGERAGQQADGGRGQPGRRHRRERGPGRRGDPHDQAAPDQRGACRACRPVPGGLGEVPPPPASAGRGVGRPPGLRLPPGVRRRRVGQCLAPAEGRPQRRIRRRGRREPGRVTAVLPVRVRRRRDPPPGGPHVVVAQPRPGRQPERGEQVIPHGHPSYSRAVASALPSHPRGGPNASSSTSLTSGRAGSGTVVLCASGSVLLRASGATPPRASGMAAPAGGSVPCPRPIAACRPISRLICRNVAPPRCT